MHNVILSPASSQTLYYARNRNSEEFGEFKRENVYSGRLTCVGITDLSLYPAELENNEASDHDQAHYTSD